MSASWDERRAEIRGRIAREGVDDFLSWSVVQATMWVGEADFVHKEFGRVAHLCAMYDIDAADTNGIHQLHHLQQWLSVQPDGVDALRHMSRIVEIGGGYGSMAEMVHKLGFNGDYFMYDFPEVRRLQDYYLGKKGIKVSSAYPPLSGDLLIACSSLSEMDMHERDLVLRGMSFRHVLISYHHVWDGIDNDKYFSGWGTVIDHPNLKHTAYAVR